MGIRVGIGNLAIGGAGTKAPDSFADLSFWAQGRSGFSLLDKIAGNDASILTPVANPYQMLSGGGALERFFDGQSHTFYYRFKVHPDKTFGGWGFDFGTSTSTNKRGLNWYCYGTNLTLCYSDGIAGSEPVMLANAPTLLKAGGWCEMFLEVDFPNKQLRCSIFDETHAQIGTTFTVSIAYMTFVAADNVLSMTNTGDKCLYLDIKKFVGLKTIAQCRQVDYVTGIEFYVPDLTTGVDISGNNHHVWMWGTKYYDSKADYLLKYGYTRWECVTGTDPSLYIPNKLNGDAVDVTGTPFYALGAIGVNMGVNYIAREHIAGSLTQHNGADGYIEFVGGAFDRSSATIFKALARDATLSDIGQYDSTHPKRWHPMQLNRLVFDTWLNTNYKGTIFSYWAGGGVNKGGSIKEFFSFTANKTGGDYDALLTYTEDFAVLNNTIKLTCVLPASESVLLILAATNSVNRRTIIKWGDGTYTLVYLDLTDHEFAHNYAAAGTYIIELLNPDLITYWSHTSDASGNHVVYDVSQFVTYCKDSLTVFYDGNYVAEVFGDITGCNKLTVLGAYHGKAKFSADVTDLTELADLYCLGDTALRGTINNLKKVTRFYVAGKSTLTGSPQNMTLVETFESCRSYTDNQMFINISGTFNGLAHLRQICFQSLSSPAIDVDTVPTLRYLSGNIIATGSVNNLPALQYLSVVGLTGDFLNCPDLSLYYDAVCGLMSQLYRLNTLPHIEAIWNEVQNYTSAQLNQLLADLWSTRDHPRDKLGSGYFFMRFRPPNGAKPTGQGLTDMAALMSYKTPNNTGTKAWDIETNLVIGIELLVNGTFAVDANWTKPAGYSIADGKFKIATTTSQFSAQSLSGKIENGEKYLCKAVVSSFTAGSCHVYLGGSAGHVITAAGTFYWIQTGSTGDPYIYVQDGGDSTLEIDEISTKKIS
jgi:hypothetical protein